MVRDIGSGNFGVAKLMRHKETRELVAMKYIERGNRVSRLRGIALSLDPSAIVRFENNFILFCFFMLFL